MTAPDPMKGLSGIFAAPWCWNRSWWLLALLVLPLSGAARGDRVIVVLGVLMIVASGLQRRPWGRGLADGIAGRHRRERPAGAALVCWRDIRPGLAFLLYCGRCRRQARRGELPSSSRHDPREPRAVMRSAI